MQRLHTKFDKSFYFLYNIKVMDSHNINLRTQTPRASSYGDSSRVKIIHNPYPSETEHPLGNFFIMQNNTPQPTTIHLHTHHIMEHTPPLHHFYCTLTPLSALISQLMRHQHHVYTEPKHRKLRLYWTPHKKTSRSANPLEMSCSGDKQRITTSSRAVFLKSLPLS